MSEPAAAFTAEVYQNQYLPAGGDVVDAVITVTATGTGLHTGGAPTAAEVIMIDCSGSMANPPTKLAEAKKACATAIDTLRDGVAFAIIAGRHDAQMVFPPDSTLAPATPANKEAAKAAVQRLLAAGGTAIGEWLGLANRVFSGHPAEVKHAIMLTDGRNQHETPAQLAATLSNCEGRFICDSRGVGADWVANELRSVASTLLGTADGLEDPSELPAAFQAMTQAAMGKAIAEASLRVWSPAGATVRFVKQAFPQVEDLTGRRTDLSARVGEYPTGAWGAESRDYHISIQVPVGTVGEEVLAARVSLVSGDSVLAQSLVLATWTDDTALSTKINQRVAHYTGQAELASAIQEGLAARDAGDVEKATSKLGRAVQLAEESGHTDTAKLLGRVVEVIDAPTGTIRLKPKVAGVDAELANVRSVKTIRVKKSEEG
ncbi:VWA domain-containing protein [Rugosimonospora acidiphila]|uniref:VWA domain-containing protein n=1 Tax=Rugosimonospora acidiphila TaxID=556531 RepID=A0ABP9SRK8_9ACTN